MASLNYAQAGVNREVADKFVEKISLLTRSTLNRRVKASIGGYASLYAIDKKRLIAASTDGVGTKLKLAFQLKEHHTVGIDLVAMSVNDILCVGAEPMFFLDYFATGGLDSGVAEQVLRGIVEGCHQARCALVGGETAEMPDFYSPGEYDLAGFAVGVVDSKRVLPKKEIRPGDSLIGLGSSGCHSNGYSLLRKLLESEEGENKLQRARELLIPTRIYARSVLPLIKERTVKGLSHITGSGFLNVPRMSEKVSYELRLPDQRELAPIYDWVRQTSGLPLEELAQTFNLGIGMVAVVPAAKVSAVLSKLKRAGESAWEIGEVVRRRKGQGSEIFLSDGASSVTLTY
jgi:phosphoribosylformylglycinamidine cyclo-ligase